MTEEPVGDGVIDVDHTVIGKQSRKRFLVSVGAMTAALAGGIAGIVSQGMGGAHAMECCAYVCTYNVCPTGIYGGFTCCHDRLYNYYTCTQCLNKSGQVICYVWSANCASRPEGARR